MEAKKKTPSGTGGKILAVLQSGEKATSFMLNNRFGFSDARKRISELRAKGYPISDYTLEDRRKVYFIHDAVNRGGADYGK